jgi:selenocysteine-specific elongation factor
MVDAVLEDIRAHGTTNVAAVRDRFNTSRRYAIALLEHLDETRVTRRQGDDRVLY